MASDFFALYHDERIALNAPLTTKKLIVHLGNPGPTIEVGAHALNYEQIEFCGKGVFRVLRDGKQLWRYEQ